MRLKAVDDALKTLVTVQTVGDRFAELCDYANRFAALVCELPTAQSAPIVGEVRREVDRWLAVLGSPAAAESAPPAVTARRMAPTAVVRRWLYDNPDGGTMRDIHLATRGKFETTVDPREAVRLALKHLRYGRFPRVRLVNGVYRGTVYLRNEMVQ